MDGEFPRLRVGLPLPPPGIAGVPPSNTKPAFWIWRFETVRHVYKSGRAQGFALRAVALQTQRFVRRASAGNVRRLFLWGPSKNSHPEVSTDRNIAGMAMPCRGSPARIRGSPSATARAVRSTERLKVTQSQEVAAHGTRPVNSTRHEPVGLRGLRPYPRLPGGRQAALWVRRTFSSLPPSWLAARASQRPRLGTNACESPRHLPLESRLQAAPGGQSPPLTA
jgi:hypothetical protein